MKNNIIIRVWLYSDKDRTEYRDSATYYATNKNSLEHIIKYALTENEQSDIERIIIANELRDQNGVEFAPTIIIDEFALSNLLGLENNLQRVADVATRVYEQGASYIINF